MARADATGPGPGWRGACALAGALLWLHPLLLRAQPSSATANACGKPAVTGKIYGGQNAPDQRWPWQASLLYHGRHICGAALIDANWVASAAHCFQKSHNPSDYRILLGYNQLQHPTKHSLQMTVYRVIVHDDFNKRYFMGSDITLLQLHLPVKFTSHILPACLPGPDMQLPSHTSCWITGWGMLTEEGFLPAPMHLQEGEVGVMEPTVCNSYFMSPDSSNNTHSVHEDMLCAGDLMTGKSICRGDSGGPLVCKLNSVWFLMGLSSWSRACNEPIAPSVFTRLTYFSNWISEKQRASPNPDPSSAPPQEKPPALSGIPSLGTIHKPRACITLVFSQTSLLLWISLGTL